MRSFKKIILMAVILLCMEGIMSFLLEPVTYQHTLDRELKYMEQQGWNPNVVLLGDSMVACGLVPGAMEEALGEDFCVLNAATGSQQVWGSYYYLEDLMNQYELKCVVMGVDQWAFTQQEKSIKRDLIVLDRIKSPRIRMKYVSAVFQPAEYPYLLKSYANREEIRNIPEHLRQKLTKEYLFGKRMTAERAELERGHTSNGAGMGEEKVGINELDPFHKDSIDQRAVQYLDKIVDLCRKKGVRLYLVSMPVTSPSVFATETYEDFWSFFESYAQQKDILFWDMNMLKDRDVVIPDGMMWDTVHVGSPGDLSVSRKFGEALKLDFEGKDTKHFFWTYSEWRDELSGIVGCDFYTEPVMDSEDRILTAVSLHPDHVIPEYEIWISTEGPDDNWIRLQEYSTSDSCVIPGGYFKKDVWMKVHCRERGSDAVYEKSCWRKRSAE